MRLEALWLQPHGENVEGARVVRAKEDQTRVRRGGKPLLVLSRHAKRVEAQGLPHRRHAEDLLAREELRRDRLAQVVVELPHGATWQHNRAPFATLDERTSCPIESPTPASRTAPGTAVSSRLLARRSSCIRRMTKENSLLAIRDPV